MVFATPNNKRCFHFVLQCKCDICKHSIRMIFFRLQIKICQQDQLDKIHCNGLFTWGKLTKLGELAHLREGIFISLSYGIFYLTAKSLLRHWKKIVLITWSLCGNLQIFNMASRRQQQFHFTVCSIMNMITIFSVLLQLNRVLLTANNFQWNIEW